MTQENEYMDMDMDMIFSNDFIHQIIIIIFTCNIVIDNLHSESEMGRGKNNIKRDKDFGLCGK